MVNVAPAEYERITPITAMTVNEKSLFFVTPNDIVDRRVKTLFTKEPATIEWLSRIREGEVLLDVGANVGLYSCFAAIMCQARVFAFEPESQNFSLLAKNCAVNRLDDKVTPFCAALSDEIRLDKLYLSEFKWDGGSSCHSFGDEVGYDLQERKSPFAQGCVSWTIDAAVATGIIPVPEYIKIDVDGFEHKVVRGGRRTFKNRKLKSICVEINTNLDVHKKLVKEIEAYGFYFDPAQVESSTRKAGPFKGCAEIIFNRDATGPVVIKTSDWHSDGDARAAISTNSLRKKIDRAQVHTDPFPYFIIDEFFPKAYYKQILQMFPGEKNLVPLGETGRVTANSYMERRVMPLKTDSISALPAIQREFWNCLVTSLYEDRVLRSFIKKFLPWCGDRLTRAFDARGSVDVNVDGLVVSDRTNYAIGPHTDSSARLLSLLFYMPSDDSYADLGTKIYRPRDPGFSCSGGPHYGFEAFEEVKQVKFLPNRVFGFLRSARSFHGVEKISLEGVDRRLLIVNLRAPEESYPTR